MRISFTFFATFFLLFVYAEAFSQQGLVTEEHKKQLDALSAKTKAEDLASRQKALSMAQRRGWNISRRTKGGGVVALHGINKNGFPIFLTTHDNIISAATTNTNAVQPGGSLGLNLS